MQPSLHCKSRKGILRSCLPALPALSSPRPHGRTPTIPPASSNARRSTIRQRLLRAGGIIPPGKGKTRPESALAAAATIIASGAIRGRNHAEPVFHVAVDCRLGLEGSRNNPVMVVFDRSASSFLPPSPRRART